MAKDSKGSDDEFVIELDVPVSNRKRGRKADTPLGHRLQALRAAPVGASVFVPGDTRRDTVNLCSRAAQYLGKGNFITRSEGDGRRVWKTGEKT